MCKNAALVAIPLAVLLKYSFLVPFKGILSSMTTFPLFKGEALGVQVGFKDPAIINSISPGKALKTFLLCGDF